MPDRRPLQITRDVLEQVVRHSQRDYPEEACGYVISRSDRPFLGVRVIRMRNATTADPKTNASMDPDEVLAVYDDLDALGEDPIAVYHSHTDSHMDSPTKMSPKDLANAHDPDLAHLIVSLQDPNRPLARAYRVEHEFIGQRRAHEVRIQVGDQEKFDLPEWPWALAPGNSVRLSYLRSRGAQPNEVHALVESVKEGIVRLQRMQGTSGIRGAVPESINTDRIIAVHVVHEGPAGREMRRRMQRTARSLAAFLASGAVDLAAEPAAVLAAAHPTTINVTIETEE